MFFEYFLWYTNGAFDGVLIFIMNYEISFLLKNEEGTELENIFKKFGVNLIDEKPIQKISLSYPVKKQKNAFFGSFLFDIEKDTEKEGIMEKIKKEINSTDNVLRFIIVRLVKKRENKERKTKDKKTIIGMKPTFVRKKQKTQVLTNKVLEEKIEEILG